MHVALVVQLYGPDVLGGAENHARLIAERLTHDLGWKVTVFTTTARNGKTPHAFKAGSTELNGVTVRRFSTRWQIKPSIFRAINRLLLPLIKMVRGSNFSPQLERLWLMLHGPYCPDLIDSLKAEEPAFTKIIFFTGLHWPTQVGVRLFPHKALLVPAAHDEAPFYFESTRETLRITPRLIVHSSAERDSFDAILPGMAKKISVGGLGFDEQATKPPTDRKHKNPNLLYLGPVSKAHGVDALFDFFMYYIDETANKETTLKIAGPLEGGIVIPRHFQVTYEGIPTPQEKLRLMQEATVIINPSHSEKIALTVAEAMAMEKPVLINRHSPGLSNYAHQATAFIYEDYASFKSAFGAALNCAENGNSTWKERLAASRAWACDRFNWRTILQTYKDACNAF